MLCGGCRDQNQGCGGHSIPKYLTLAHSVSQEEEERKAREEQAQREHEEYLKLKEAFVVEEEGVGETMTEEQVGLPHLGNPPCSYQGGPPPPRHPAAPHLSP